MPISFSFLNLLVSDFADTETPPDLSRELKTAVCNTFLGEEKPQHYYNYYHLWKYRLSGCPYLLTKPSGQARYHGSTKLWLWIFYLSGGFISYPILNLIKLFTLLPLNLVEQFCKYWHSYVVQKIRNNTRRQRLWKAISWLTFPITSFFWSVTKLARIIVIRPFLDPGDSLMAAKSTKEEIGKVGSAALIIGSLLLSSLYYIGFFLFSPFSFFISLTLLTTIEVKPFDDIARLEYYIIKQLKKFPSKKLKELKEYEQDYDEEDDEHEQPSFYCKFLNRTLSKETKRDLSERLRVARGKEPIEKILPQSTVGPIRRALRRGLWEFTPRSTCKELDRLLFLVPTTSPQ